MAVSRRAVLKRRPARPRLSRDEKARRTHDAILTAAQRVVAADGYAAASIARMAEEAGVAQGTFYNYFEDRQALFDQLLPHEGLRMRAWVERASHTTGPGMEREFARFEAFLDYVSEHEGFYRILVEAEVFAPQAHRAHMDNIVQGYTRSFRRAMTEGRALVLDDLQLTCLIHQLLGMRAYAAMQIHHAASKTERAQIKQAATQMYRLLLSESLLRPD
ncbi:TetR/AcrR family transcriptional regulator [Aquicoccus sp. G2-2]|jgi:AcrR family transcriptional regulator|uniref:TetR/AcrR family transcriptional regulator n=1 Tax=Aquicoccus sp. G2-2 TaxID=3092120 RepID=UPI002ADF3757|nr:helix-turn-helix domain-containing protein [Aquicoccus sp. G2-2]MEA1114878.1 helix-turn-helix domain-containing protein [Aquicoccus sp. G2-2]